MNSVLEVLQESRKQNRSVQIELNEMLNNASQSKNGTPLELVRIVKGHPVFSSGHFSERISLRLSKVLKEVLGFDIDEIALKAGNISVKYEGLIEKALGKPGSLDSSNREFGCSGIIRWISDVEVEGSSTSKTLELGVLMGYSRVIPAAYSGRDRLYKLINSWDKFNNKDKSVLKKLIQKELLDGAKGVIASTISSGDITHETIVYVMVTLFVGYGNSSGGFLTFGKDSECVVKSKVVGSKITISKELDSELEEWVKLMSKLSKQEKKLLNS